jgi:hypothetical protein
MRETRPDGHLIQQPFRKECYDKEVAVHNIETKGGDLKLDDQVFQAEIHPPVP